MLHFTTFHNVSLGISKATKASNGERLCFNSALVFFLCTRKLLKCGSQPQIPFKLESEVFNLLRSFDLMMFELYALLQ